MDLKTDFTLHNKHSLETKINENDFKITDNSLQDQSCIKLIPINFSTTKNVENLNEKLMATSQNNQQLIQYNESQKKNIGNLQEIIVDYDYNNQVHSLLDNENYSNKQQNSAANLLKPNENMKDNNEYAKKSRFDPHIVTNTTDIHVYQKMPINTPKFNNEMQTLMDKLARLSTRSELDNKQIEVYEEDIQDYLSDNFTFGNKSEFSFGNNFESFMKSQTEEFNNDTYDFDNDDDIFQNLESLTLINYINFIKIEKHINLKNEIINMNNLMILHKIGDYGHSIAYKIADLQTKMYYILKLYKNSPNDEFQNNELTLIKNLNEKIIIKDQVSNDNTAVYGRYPAHINKLINLYSSKNISNTCEYSHIFPKTYISGTAEISSVFFKLFPSLNYLFYEQNQYHLTDGSTIFMIMEYGSSSLRSVIDRRKQLKKEGKITGIWKFIEFVDIIESLADILIVFQKEKLTCGCLKPEKIMFFESEDQSLSLVKITDFHYSSDIPNINWEDQIDLDKYIAPELKHITINDKLLIDIDKVDLYSLGIIMIELKNELDNNIIQKYRDCLDLLDPIIKKFIHTDVKKRGKIQELKRVMTSIRLIFNNRIYDEENEEKLIERNEIFQLLSNLNDNANTNSLSTSVDSLKTDLSTCKLPNTIFLSKEIRISGIYPTFWDELTDDQININIHKSIKSKAILCELYCNATSSIDNSSTNNTHNNTFLSNHSKYTNHDDEWISDKKHFLMICKNLWNGSHLLIESISMLLKDSSDLNFDKLFIINLFKPTINKLHISRLLDIYGISLYLKYLPILEHYIISRHFSRINTYNNNKPNLNSIIIYDIICYLKIYGQITQSKHCIDLYESIIACNIISDYYKECMKISLEQPKNLELRINKEEIESLLKKISDFGKKNITYLEKIIEIYLKLHLKIMSKNLEEAEKYLFDILALNLNEYSIIMLKYFIDKWLKNNQYQKILAAIEPIFHQYVKNNSIDIYKSDSIDSNLFWMFSIVLLIFGGIDQIKYIQNYVKNLLKFNQKDLETNILKSFTSFTHHFYDIYSFNEFYTNLIDDLNNLEEENKEIYLILDILANPINLLESLVNKTTIANESSIDNLIRENIELIYITDYLNTKNKNHDDNDDKGYILPDLLHSLKHILIHKNNKLYECILIIKWIYRLNFNNIMNNTLIKPRYLKNLINITHDHDQILPQDKLYEYYFWIMLIFFAIIPSNISHIKYIEYITDCFKNLSCDWIKKVNENNIEKTIKTVDDDDDITLKIKNKIDEINKAIKYDLYHLLKFTRSGYLNKQYIDMNW